jgi:mRNA interferase MazF
VTYKQFDVVVVPFTFTDSLVIKKIGKLATGDRDRVQESLQQLFDF